MGRLTRFVDEHDWGFGWVSTKQPMLRLTSHALLADGGVWLTDPASKLPSVLPSTARAGSPP